jgi:RNA polymerase sigma-70 factor (ECF subfamily)
MDEADVTLVQRSQAGEQAAFDELVRRHRPDLVRFAAFMTGDAHEAENLAQETLTRALVQLGEFRQELPFGPWLRGIALNVCRNYLRDRARHAKLVPPEQFGAVAAVEGRRQGVLSGILRQEVNERTLEAIRQLPNPLREAFVLHFVEGLDYAHMAAIAGEAAGTLRVRAHRARTLLRSSLGSIVDTWLREGGRDPEAG